MKFSASKQSGFTLVEIAIVLVIIGILLAGVLKGQALINNGRIKGLVANMNGVSSGYNGFIDRYQSAPGTETIANALARHGWTITTNGAVYTAALLSPATTFAPGNVQRAFWQELIQAGFITGDPAGITNPVSANSGSIGVSFTPFTLLQGASVCLSSLTPQQAAGVDSIIDGATPTTAGSFGANTGTVQGIIGAGGATITAPNGAAPTALGFAENSGQYWTLCRTL